MLPRLAQVIFEERIVERGGGEVRPFDHRLRAIAPEPCRQPLWRGRRIARHRPRRKAVEAQRIGPQGLRQRLARDIHAARRRKRAQGGQSVLARESRDPVKQRAIAEQHAAQQCEGARVGNRRLIGRDA